MIITDQLFEENFEPAWKTRERRLIESSLEQAITTETNYAFQVAAEASRDRILSRCDGRNNYSNAAPRKPKKKRASMTPSFQDVAGA